MLYSESQILKFHKHCVLIVSEQKSFCDQILSYLNESTFESLYLQSTDAFPTIDTIESEKTYLCILDLDHRPGNTLNWLSDLKAKGINISVLVLGRGYYSNLIQHLILRAYSLVAWSYLDTSDLCKEKFQSTLASMLRDRDVAYLLNDNEHQVLSALNSIDESVVRVTTDLKIEYMNASAENLAGSTLSALLGQHLDRGFDFF